MFSFTLYITTDCNLKCQYCYEDYHNHYQLNEKTLVDSLEFIMNYGDRGKVLIDFLGGEPLLKKNLIYQAVSYIKNNYPEIDEFQKIKNSFSSLEEFQTALKTDPDKYGAALPQVSGYTYTESDGEEYIQAYSLSSNDTIRNEVNGMDQSLLSIKNKKFPSALPVLTMISSENQMEGDMVRSGKNIHATMIYPFVRMLQEKCRDLTEEQIHKTLWKEYEISGADRMFVERASKILEPYEGESEDEK